MEKKEKNKEKELEEKMKKEEKETVKSTETNEEEVEETDYSEMSKEELETEIEKLKKENDKYYKHLQRTIAEFDNYKKRVSKERDEIYALAVGDVVSEYINVLDNIDRAVAVETADAKMKQGVEMIRKQMLGIMSNFGVTEIPTVNETFNPEVHDAVMHVESEEYGEQVVVEELRKGYRRGSRIIRHAMVKVAN